MIRILIGPALFVAVGLGFGPGGSRALATTARDSTPGVIQEPPRPMGPDSSDVLGKARDAQARFERRHHRLLPWAFAESGRPCENRVGRFCMWHSGDDSWKPIPDPPELADLREALLTELSELSAQIPGDRWILGQRVFYLAEAGRWSEAAQLAGACGVEPNWWCDVLTGFALHGAGDYGPAMAAFRHGLADMDPEEARKWRDPEILLDGKAQDLMNDASEEEWEALRATFWHLADPLYLMPGNDRETEHYARWTFSRMSDRARNPHELRWGSDLEELTVRYGWEKGWERRRPNVGFVRPDGSTIGHSHPDAREFVPPGFVLGRPSQTEPGAWIPAEHPRSAHVAAYSPDLEPGVGQVAVFHRGDSILVAAATRMPEPSDSSAAQSFPSEVPSDEPDGPFAWAQPGLPDEPDQVGLFLIDSERRFREARHRGDSESVLALSVPAGRYLMSLEAWVPTTGRGGRLRHGIVTDTIPEDLATLSDLIILYSADSLPQQLDLALPLMRPSLELSSGQEIAVGWEIFGLGWRQENVDFVLSLYKEGEGFFGKVGRWLGFGGGRDEPLQIGWREPGPVETGPWFRSVKVDMPDLEPGEYLFRLEVSIRGREPLVRTRAVGVSP